MEIVDGKVDLGSIKLSSRFFEAFAFPEVGEHFSSSDEVHDKEDFFFGLEGVFQFNKERMVGYIT